MLKSVLNRNSVLVCLADCPADNQARQLAQFLYETLAAILMKNLLIIGILILTSCNPSYEITEDKIKSSQKIENGFSLKQIKVSEYDESGRPTKYSDSTILVCSPLTSFSVYLSQKLYSTKEKEIYQKNREIMDSIMEINDNVLGGEGHDKGIDKYFESQMIIEDLENKKFQFKAKKSIFLNKENKSYKWIFTSINGMYDYEREIHDTLPIKFIKNQWYLIDFSNTSNIINKLFFRIGTDKEIEQYHYYKYIWGV